MLDTSQGKKVGIVTSSHVVPKVVVDNATAEELFTVAGEPISELLPSKIVRVTGIENRFWSGDDVYPSTLAAEAVQSLVGGVDTADLLVFASASDTTAEITTPKVRKGKAWSIIAEKIVKPARKSSPPTVSRTVVENTTSVNESASVDTANIHPALYMLKVFFNPADEITNNTSLW